MKACVGYLLLFLGFELWAGQAPVSAPERPAPSVAVSMGFSGTAFAIPAIPGKPYSAKQVTEHTQTLADGTHITQPARTELVYRDSSGRIRTERPVGPINLAEQYIIVEIRDPIAQVQYTLDPVNKVAHRIVMQTLPRGSGGGAAAVRSGAFATGAGTSSSLQPPTSSGGVSAARTAISFAPGGAPTGGVISNGPNGIQHQREDLGPQVMEGLAVQGTKFTTTVPAGAQGNDRPLTTVREQWVARDLGLTVLSHIIDPRNGETTIKMTDISTVEPDASLFAPPSDYSVAEEAGGFQIKFYAQPKQQQ